MEKVSNKKKLGGYPAFGVVFSITLALLVIGLFGLLVIFSQQLEHLVRENVRLQVYLNSSVSETQRLQIENKLISMDFVNKSNPKPIEYVSREEAADKFILETGEDFRQFIGENPLKDAFMVSIDPSYHSQGELKKIKEEIQKTQGVFEVYYVEGLIDSINANVNKIAIVLIGLVAALLFTVVLMINNTIRLALFSQRFLIRSMLLVGATGWFIQRPFLFRAAIYGLLGGLLASLLLWGLVQYASRTIADLTLLYQFSHFALLSIFLFFTGILVTTLSTLFSIRHYLKMSLDELY